MLKSDTNLLAQVFAMKCTSKLATNKDQSRTFSVSTLPNLIATCFELQDKMRMVLDNKDSILSSLHYRVIDPCGVCDFAAKYNPEILWPYPF